MQLGNHIGDQSTPAGLVRGAQAAPVVAVEIFVEEYVVLEVRIGLHLVIGAEDGTSSLLIAAKDIDLAAAPLISDLFQRQHLCGSDRAFYPAIITVQFV